ncbi:hypothetical protein [Paenibacillus nasutitermitis]|uniref:Uncharacterized protein n=1 Tax=Paenibacillus nasutitermitis TaxID=1652958 RepID=A0A916ZFU8_9BACL|nr:hypothetical protein [Paenibacillus nasutitermitis]GGD94813.1 hypothetical protein GCM10010911_61870 [Paenibacillus nasutitermitis]
MTDREMDESFIDKLESLDGIFAQKIHGWLLIDPDTKLEAACRADFIMKLVNMLGLHAEFTSTFADVQPKSTSILAHQSAVRTSWLC